MDGFYTENGWIGQRGDQLFVGEQVCVCIKNDEFCMKTDEFCMKTDGFCMKTDEFCIKNDGFCMKTDEFCIKNDEFCSSRTPKASMLSGRPQHHLLEQARGKFMFLHRNMMNF